jgi:hypothetical protein
MEINQHATTEELLEAVFTAAMNQHSIYELLATVFSRLSMPRGYQWDKFWA